MLEGTPLNILAILVVFYLYLLVRPQYVKRSICLLMGAAGILLAIVGEFFLLGDSAGVRTVCGIFTTIGNLVAFLGGVCTCFGGKLPVDFSKLGASDDTNKPK